MDKFLRKLDYWQMAESAVEVDGGIGKDLQILGDYELYPIDNYEFVASVNTVIYVKKGGGSIVIDDRRYAVSAPCIILYLTGQMIKTRIESEQTLQWSMALSDRFLEDLSLSSLKFNDIRSSILLNPVLSLTDEMIVTLDRYGETLFSFVRSPRIKNKLLCAKHLTLALFYGPMYDFFKKREESATFRTPKISSDFFDLLQVNFKNEHNLSFYAGRLSISEKYLYVTVMSATGKGPRYWIDYYLIVEAKKLLSDRDLTVQQVADQLQFSSLSSFSKYFSRLTGVSPSKFREEASGI